MSCVGAGPETGLLARRSWQAGPAHATAPLPARARTVPRPHPVCACALPTGQVPRRGAPNHARGQGDAPPHGLRPRVAAGPRGECRRTRPTYSGPGPPAQPPATAQQLQPASRPGHVGSRPAGSMCWQRRLGTRHQCGTPLWQPESDLFLSIGMQKSLWGQKSNIFLPVCRRRWSTTGPPRLSILSESPPLSTGSRGKV